MNYLHSDKIKDLEVKAKEIRESVVNFLKDDSGSTISSLKNNSLEKVDILTLLYFHILKHNPKDPNWSERDRLIFSNRDIYPALYATLAHAGYFPIEELKTLYESPRLQEDPSRAFLSVAEINFISFGFGLPRTMGMILADKINNRRATEKFFYCFLNKEELQKRQNWEIIQMAGEKRLHNFVVFVDEKNIQIDDFVEKVIPFEFLINKLEMANWQVLDVDSHDFDDMDNVIGQAQNVFAKPTVIIVR